MNTSFKSTLFSRDFSRIFAEKLTRVINSRRLSESFALNFILTPPWLRWMLLRATRRNFPTIFQLEKRQLRPFANLHTHTLFIVYTIWNEISIQTYVRKWIFVCIIFYFKFDILFYGAVTYRRSIPCDWRMCLFVSYSIVLICMY